MTGIREGLAQEIRKKLNSDNIKLPSLPDTVIKVQQLMAGDDYSVSDIARILTRDSAFATVVMRMANSARFNSTGREIRNLTTAIQRVGTTSILQLLISVASRMFCNIPQAELRRIMQKNHHHDLFVSATAEQVAHVSKAANPADTFMAALLHDLGKDVLMIAIPDEFLRASPAEREAIVEMFHREMGARLLHKWALPEEFILVAQHHGVESPDRPRLAMLDCIDSADILVHNMEHGDENTHAAITAQPPVRRLRLSETQMTGIVMDIEDHLDELRQMFGT